MWILLAFGSALFAGVTAVLAKIGMEHVDSDLATALRTGVVLVFSWLMVWITGEIDALANISAQTVVLLILSGSSTGASWIFYFRALQLGSVSHVAPIDKCSVVLTMLLAILIFREPIGWTEEIGIVLIAVGTWLMLPKEQRKTRVSGQKGWLFYALLSALFASLTSILGKMGMQDISSDLGTAIRTIVVFIMAWMIVLARGKQCGIWKLTEKNWIFLVCSGIATGLSWLCFYRALKDGPASVVVPIDKLSILVTVAFSVIVLKERLGKREITGLLLLTAGTVAMIL